MLRLSCGEGVLADLQAHSPNLPSSQQATYDMVLELYGSTRMLLAALPRSLLPRVCIVFCAHSGTTPAWIP